MPLPFFLGGGGGRGQKLKLSILLGCFNDNGL